MNDRITSPRSGILLALLVFAAFPQVLPGRHIIALTYKDHAFQIGAEISVAMWINYLAGLVLFRRRPDPVAKAVLGRHKN